MRQRRRGWLLQNERSGDKEAGEDQAAGTKAGAGEGGREGEEGEEEERKTKGGTTGESEASPVDTGRGDIE
jgi:hypothetical protein